MRIKSAFFFLGGFALFGITLWICSYSLRTPASPANPQVNVVVATVPLEFGDRIAQNKLTVLSMFGKPPSGSFRSISSAVGDGHIVARRAIAASEAIVSSAVVEEIPHLSSGGAIQVSMRALAVEMNDVSGLGGVIYPGDRVDVFFSQSTPYGEFSTSLLIQDVRILAFEHGLVSKKDAANSRMIAVLELSPLSVEKVLVAERMGTLYFALRNDLDERDTQMQGFRSQDLVGRATAIGR